MTLTEFLQIGDEVVFNFSSECHRRLRNYEGVTDGTKGVICGLSDSLLYQPRVGFFKPEPGVYHRKKGISVWLADGRVIRGDWIVELADKELENRRRAEIASEDYGSWGRLVRLGDLPETKFWEEDKVRIFYPDDGRTVDAIVDRIEYDRMHDRYDDASPWPFYDIFFPEGFHQLIQESRITLIERGNVWKHYNNQPLTFVDLNDEANFFKLIGQSKEVCNPQSGLYDWTKEEVIQALKNGIVHSYFGLAPHFKAERFNNEELGSRVAQSKLEALGINA